MNARAFRSAVLLVVCTVLCMNSALGAPLRAGVAISEGAGCRVSLTKVSYDDPGADDAELLELFVERLSDAGASADAGLASSDAAAGPAMLTLGDCGLGALELVNGGGGACETYRTLPLSSLPVPNDDYVTFCATDSLLAGVCDVKTAGLSALKNGWLQNGPSDGLRFVDRDGSVMLELAYEGGPPCFARDALHLVDETGQLAGASEPTDDVNTFCGDRFVLLSPAAAPLRGEAGCPVAAPRVLGDAALTTPVGVSGPDSGAGGRSWTAERAPAIPSRGTPSPSGTLGLDAGLVAIARTASVPPKAPGCSLIPGATSRGFPVGGGRLVSAIALIFALTRCARRERTVEDDFPLYTNHPPRRGQPRGERNP
jgi:hypothetical protein